MENESNELTYAAMEEAENMLKEQNVKRFSSVEDLFLELEADED